AASVEALHTFTLDSGATRCYFHDCTIVTPLTTPVPVSLADPLWGPSRSTCLHRSPVSDQESYFLLVVDDYTRYTTVFPLRSKADVTGVSWITTLCRQLRARFQEDLQVLRLHSDRGGEFSSRLLEGFCRTEGIAQSSTFGPMSLCQRPRLHCFGRGRFAMRWRFGSRVRSPLSAIPPRASSLLALSAASSLASPPTPRPRSFTTLPRAASCPHRTSPLMSRSASTVSTCTCPPHSPRRPSSWSQVPPQVDPLPPQGPAPSGVSQVDPPPLVEPLEASSDTSGPAKGGDPVGDDMAATRRSLRLETPPGFPPQPSSPPLQPVAVD
ncbi:unnamed protein product, partial [Closterium sp. NIES-54]